MKITTKQIAEFAENNDMVAMGEDWFEDAGGNVIHEANVEDMIKEGKAMWPDMNWKMFTKVHSSECGCEECEK